MKKLQESTVSHIQDKVTSFGKEIGSFADPTKAWDALTQKVNEFKSSDKENKFVTMTAFMNLFSALIQITF